MDLGGFGINNMTELRIIAAGDAVSDVQLVEWVAIDGAMISKGDPIYSVESDKSVLEVSSPASGKLTILENAGQAYPMGHLVGRID
jgi:pyruvate/2-oxoglutarate dehydrogenase complex dihydrolipoamide acyltransferase (E2) component